MAFIVQMTENKHDIYLYSLKEIIRQRQKEETITTTNPFAISCAIFIIVLCDKLQNNSELVSLKYKHFNILWKELDYIWLEVFPEADSVHFIILNFNLQNGKSISIPNLAH